MWNGICAALVSAASDSRTTGITSRRGLCGSGAGKLDHARDGQRHAVNVQKHKARQKRDAAQHLRMIAGKGILDGLRRARVANHEERAYHGGDFTMQNSHSRLSLVTMTNIAGRNRNMSARNCGRRSVRSARAVRPRARRGPGSPSCNPKAYTQIRLPTMPTAEDHDRAHVVQVERRRRDGFGSGQRHGCKGERAHQLDYAEHRGERVPIFVRVVQDDGAQDDVDNGTDDREHMRGTGGNLKALRTRAKT